MKTVGTRSNRDGIGTRIELTAAGKTQVREVRSGTSYLSHSGQCVGCQVSRASLK